MLSKLCVLHLWCLLASIGCTLCELRYCKEEEVMKCIELAIRSYMKNTQGEEAAEGPLDMMAGRLVGGAMGTSIQSTPSEFNQACSVLSNVDMDRVTGCMDDLDKYCTMKVPKNHVLINTTLPSVRLLPTNKLASFFEVLCAKECAFLTLGKSIMTMLNCYKKAIPIAGLAEEGSLSKDDCKIFQRYIECQWDNSAGCDALELITRHYFSVMEDRINDCAITLPPEVFGNTTNSGGSSRPSLLLQAAAVLMYGIMIHVLLSLNLMK